jgi:hypothetical protein
MISSLSAHVPGGIAASLNALRFSLMKGDLHAHSDRELPAERD